MGRKYIFSEQVSENVHLRKHTHDTSRVYISPLEYYSFTYIYRYILRRLTLWPEQYAHTVVDPPGNLYFHRIKGVIAQKTIYLFPFLRGDLLKKITHCRRR